MFRKQTSLHSEGQIPYPHKIQNIHPRFYLYSSAGVFFSLNLYWTPFLKPSDPLHKRYNLRVFVATVLGRKKISQFSQAALNLTL